MATPPANRNYRYGKKKSDMQSTSSRVDLQLCPLSWTSHGCDRIAGHDGDHLCIGYAPTTLQLEGTGWCQYVGLESGQWAALQEICDREPAGSSRLFE